MKTKTILSIAIIATLPLTAMAENISGAMYVAPTTSTQNNPAPKTNAIAPYGRINIDTADQQHVASTAYVKGAYNSAIAAVNGVYSVAKSKNELGFQDEEDGVYYPILNEVLTDVNDVTMNDNLVTGLAVKNAIDAVDGKIGNQRAVVYTTWNDDRDSATVQVPLITVSGN